MLADGETKHVRFPGKLEAVAGEMSVDWRARGESSVHGGVRRDLRRRDVGELIEFLGVENRLGRTFWGQSLRVGSG